MQRYDLWPRSAPSPLNQKKLAIPLWPTPRSRRSTTQKPSRDLPADRVLEVDLSGAPGSSRLATLASAEPQRARLRQQLLNSSRVRRNATPQRTAPCSDVRRCRSARSAAARFTRASSQTPNAETTVSTPRCCRIRQNQRESFLPRKERSIPGAAAARQLVARSRHSIDRWALHADPGAAYCAGFTTETPPWQSTVYISRRMQGPDVR